jgi:hypothetical protein
MNCGEDNKMYWPLDAVRLISLAASPCFAIMALMTGLSSSPMDRFCSFGHIVPLTGMATMYLLMSAFHSPAWLNLLGGPNRIRPKAGKRIGIVHGARH